MKMVLFICLIVVKVHLDKYYCSINMATDDNNAKKTFAQFFSTKAPYIFDGFPSPPASHVVEPFAGRGDLIEWTRTQGFTGQIDAYDIMPQHPYIIRQDTLRTPPTYKDKWVVTNPPFIARNKTTAHKDLFDEHETNDLFKVFLMSLVYANAAGGFIIIPLNFISSVRPIDVTCREKFFSKYQAIRINMFEETVFDDTACTVIALWFRKLAIGEASNQSFLMVRYPSRDQRMFSFDIAHKWLIGGSIYSELAATPVTVCRAMPDLAPNTNLKFTAIDSGKATGRISLEWSDATYIGKDTSRTFATLVIGGLPLGVVMTEDLQKEVAEIFNERFEAHREQYWSLFLTNYRESKEYARKRAPFTLCYLLVQKILHEKFY